MRITVLILLTLLAAPAWALTDIDTCDQAAFTTGPGETYRLTADLVCDSDGGGASANTAIRIDAASPTFDFNGHTLTYANDDTGYGILFVSSTGSVTITNSDSTAGAGTIEQTSVDLSSSENDLITAITGTSTAFTSFFQVGDMIKPTSGSDQRPRIVTQINSDTELLVNFPWIQEDIENWDLDETTDLDPNVEPSWTETISAGATYARIRGGIRFTKFANSGLPGNNTSNFVAHGIKVSNGTNVTSLTITNVSFYLTPSEAVLKDRWLIGLWITADPAAMTIQNNGFWIAVPPLTAATGTVSTGGTPSTSIVGSGTAFTTELRVGQGITGESGSGAGASFIVSIEDDEHLTSSANLTFTAGSTMLIGSLAEVNGVRADISVNSTGGLWQDNNFYISGALGIGGAPRSAWWRATALHPGGESGKHIFDGNTYRSKSGSIYGWLCDSCEWIEQRNQQFFKGGSGNQIWWDHCDDCELHGNLLLAGPGCSAGGIGNRGTTRTVVYRNVVDYRLSKTCSFLEGGGTTEGETIDHIFRDNKIFLSITGTGGNWNNRVFGLEAANEGYQFYNNTVRIHRPAGAPEFERSFLFLFRLGQTLDDILSAYNEIHRTSGDEGVVSKPYYENGSGSTNEVICADVVDGIEVTEANHADYFRDLDDDQLTVPDDPSCGCEPSCGPTVGARTLEEGGAPPVTQGSRFAGELQTSFGSR